VRFRTQEVDITLPEEGDIYSILRYLALVTPLKEKSAMAPPAADQNDANSFQIVFSPNPERMAALGWGRSESGGTRFLGLDAFNTANPVVPISK
jgi:hypothetical protein